MIRDRPELWADLFRAITEPNMLYNKIDKCADNFLHSYYDTVN